MAETNNRHAGTLGVADSALDDEGELAQEFKQVLRDLAGELASVATGPPVEGLLDRVRASLQALIEEVKEEVGKELTALREERGKLLAAVQHQVARSHEDSSRLLGRAVETGLADATKVFGKAVEQELRPMVDKTTALSKLEEVLRGEAGRAREAVGDALKQVRGELQAFARDSDAIKTALTGTAQQFGQQAETLRRTVEGTVPALDTACRNLQAGQESLKGMLRGYNETLDKSITALETKFAGILAASLERINQRQSELENRIRSTADRTEEAVVDLMQGNQAHHQAMVDSTAASLSQLEFFAKSLRQMHSAQNGLLFLVSGAVLGLGYIAYTLFAGR